MNATIIHGDSLVELKNLEPNSVDSIVTDPPYALGFMGKAWDTHTPKGFQTWCEAWAKEALRVLKPGGHLLAFGGTRTYHRLTSGIEDAGFEIRDSLHWLYGSGFPKSLDVSKAIDKAAGAERAVVGSKRGPGSVFLPGNHNAGGATVDAWRESRTPGMALDITAPATDAAKQWQGWGTALKPAHEPIVLARKPLTGTVAGNVLQYGTGGINVDGCRVGTWSEFDRRNMAVSSRGPSGKGHVGYYDLPGSDEPLKINEAGRWPANVLFDEDAARVLDEQSGERPGFASQRDLTARDGGDEWGNMNKLPPGVREGYNDTGGASRFFPVFRYQAKASKRERPDVNGVKHPTVKPVELMRWLVRLVTPAGGTVLDPFAGSGATVAAALAEGMQVIAIEREADYIPLIESRLAA